MYTQHQSTTLADNTPYTPIQCGLYDYFEIACMHGYHLVIELRDGRSVSGIAQTTKIEHGAEFLVLSESKADDNVRLDEIASLKVTTKNAKFSSVVFPDPEL